MLQSSEAAPKSTRYDQVRARLESILEAMGVPVGGSFKIDNLTYYRDWKSTDDGVWTLDGMHWAIFRLSE